MTTPLARLFCLDACCRWQQGEKLGMPGYGITENIDAMRAELEAMKPPAGFWRRA